jgi:hypothetical protein
MILLYNNVVGNKLFISPLQSLSGADSCLLQSLRPFRTKIKNPEGMKGL